MQRYSPHRRCFKTPWEVREAHQQVCGVTVQYRNERLIVQQVRSIITSILFRSYQSSPPMGDFKNWSWDMLGRLDHRNVLHCFSALAVSLCPMSPWSPWLGLMAVAKAQVTWGPQPMFLSVPLQQSASRIFSPYRVNRDLSLQSCSVACWGDRWRYQSAETLWIAATSILYWNLIAHSGCSEQWTAEEFKYLTEVFLIQNNFES